MKIGIFGDSIARGIILDEKEKRYKLLSESAVNFVKRKTKIDIENFSSYGCTVNKSATLLERVKDEISEFDYTLIALGGNDCDYNWAEVSQNPDIPHLPKTPLKIFKSVYTTMIEKITSLGSTPILVSLPPIDSGLFFDWVSKGLSKANILSFLGSVDHIAQWQASYNEVVRQLASNYKLTLLDIREKFFSFDGITKFLCSDGIHPNEAGHKLIYESIAERTGLLPLPI